MARLMDTLGKEHLLHYWWLRWEKVIFVAGLVVTLGEGHFCGGIGG